MKIKCTICGKEIDADADIVNDIAARNECLPDDLPVSCSEICKGELNKLIEKQRRLRLSIGGGEILKDPDEWAGMIDGNGTIQ
ncbi:MAG: hypothetical protein ACYCTD_05310 [bacterium]